MSKEIIRVPITVLAKKMSKRASDSQFQFSFQPKLFVNTKLLSDDKGKLSTTDENVSPNLIGTCVDYLTRLIFCQSLDAFDISKKGAAILKKIPEFEKIYSDLIANLKKKEKINNKIIADALQLCGYDVMYRAGKEFYVPVQSIVPNNVTCNHIKMMLNRVDKLFKQIGIPSRTEFEVESLKKSIFGDGDFLSYKYLLDFKTLSGKILSKNTLQILIYYVLGKQQQIYPEFQTIEQLMMYNPRKDILFTCDVDEIQDKVKQMSECIDYFDCKINALNIKLMETGL